MLPKKAQLWAWGRLAVKLGTASSLATALVKFLDLGNAFPAAIVPVLVMGQTRGSTIQTSFNRIKGTLIGTVVGTLVYQGFGSSALALFLSVSGAVFISHWMGLPGVKGAAGYVAAIILTLNSNDQPWKLAASQFVALSIGIVMTNLVDDLLWPFRAKASLRQDMREILLELRQFYQLAIEGYLVGPYQAEAAVACNGRIVALIRRIEPRWQEAVLEQHQLLRVAATWDLVLHRIWDHVQSMHQIAEAGLAEPQFHNLLELKQLADATALRLEQLAESASQHDKAALKPAPVEIQPFLTAAAAKLDQIEILPLSSPELRRFLGFFYHMQEVAMSLNQIDGRSWL